MKKSMLKSRLRVLKLPVRIVLDTNVLVSALLKGSSLPGQILTLIFAGKVIPVLEEHIFHEYEVVLARPRLKIPPESAYRTLTFLAAIGEWVEPDLSNPSLTGLALPNIQDASDLPFAQAAIAANVWALVTGNERHFTFLTDYGRRVLTPAEFLRQLTGPGE
jgi:putative PIN family toxin of toxin-antitoxin system